MTAPDPASAEPFTCASVAILTMFKPREPATPTEPPPAPEEPSAEKPPDPFVEEVSEIPTAVTEPVIEVSARTVARLIATPTPTFALPPPVADPSAVACTETVTELERLSAPPARIVTPSGTSARTKTSVTLTATAAATEMLPEDVEALGGETAVPEPPFADWVEDAKLR